MIDQRNGLEHRYAISIVKMRLRHFFVAGLAAVGMLVTSASADVFIGGAPTVDVLVNDINGTINSNILDEGANANHGRADSFTLGTSATGTFDIFSVTIAKNGNQTFNNDSFTAFIATGGATEWDMGTGHNTADDGDDYLVDTGMALQVQEVFTLDGLITGADFVTLEFAAPVTIADNTEYTLGFVYDQDSGPDRFGYDENGTGGRLSVTVAPYGGASSRGMSFSVQGVETPAVPEPTSMVVLGLGALGLIARRRRS
jgi:hypothetical protein